MSVFRNAGGRRRPPGRGRAGLGRAARGAGKALGTAAGCALMLVSVLGATASAAPASAGARAHAARMGAARATGAAAGRALPVNSGTRRSPATIAPLPRAGHAHIYPVSRGAAGAGAARPGAAAGTAADPSMNLQYHNGPVQHDPTFYAIFWLPSGTNYEPGIINGNSGYESLMARYLQDAGSTNLASLASQYYDTTSGYMNNMVPGTQYGGSWTDTTPYPEIPVLDTDFQAVVNAALAANPGWQDGANSTFFVFTGYGVDSCMNSTEQSCTPGISSPHGYCAYHNYFTDANGHQAVYASMPEDESWNAKAFFGITEGCQSTNALPNGDIYADNEFAVLSHEQWEAETDPLLDAWYNTAGEIADLCVGQFGYQPYFGPSNFNVSGHLYVLQEEWSNADSACGGADPGGSGYYAVYGPYSATAGVSTGTLTLAQTVFIPSVNVILTPNPTINWGDGTTSGAGGDTGCVICDMTGSHTYQYDPSATYPKTYQVTVTYNTGCCIAYSQSLNIVVFPPKPLKISANDQAMTYGGAVPGFTASYSGFINGDTSGVVHGLTCSATDQNGDPVSGTTPAGTYAITCGGATAPPYYAISYTPGTLTISPAHLTIAADDQQTTYGSVSFGTSAGDMTFTGFVSNEGPSVLGPGLTITSNVSPDSPAGSYQLTPAGAADANYTISYQSGTLTVRLFAAGSVPIASQSSTSCHLLLNGSSTVSVAGTLTVNGTSPSALCLNGGATISAGSIVVQGGVQNNNGTINGPVTTQQPPAPNLMATLPPPSAPAAACPGTACPQGASLSSGSTYDLLPGTYSVPVSVNKGATACVAPGIYVLTATWSLNSTALQPYGSPGCPAVPAGTTDPGVLLYFAQGHIQINGSGALSQLRAMRGGPYGGLLYWQADAETTSVNGTGAFAGGAWYEPSGALVLNSDARMTVPFVSAATITLNSRSVLTVTGS